MYALINTMQAISGDSIGTILSQHRSVAAAERADAKLQRLTRSSVGSTSYVPTTIVRLTCRPVGRWIGNCEWEATQ